MRRERGRRLPSWVIGLVLLIVIAMGSLPRVHEGAALERRLRDQGRVRLGAEHPARVAGADRGRQRRQGRPVEHLDRAPTTTRRHGDRRRHGQAAAVVTMELDEDASAAPRGRDLQAAPAPVPRGQLLRRRAAREPERPRDAEGHTFPVNQTSYSVQLDQVLTTLQGDVRADLQTLPRPVRQRARQVRRRRGLPRALPDLGAGRASTRPRSTRRVLGTQPGDLSGVINGLDRVVRGPRPQRGRAAETWSPTSGSSRARSRPRTSRSARRSRSSRTRSRRRSPAFANLNAAFPPLRAFAREALPGVRSTPATLRAATPFIDQVRALVSERELRGLVADLRPTIPELAELAHRTVPFLEQARSLSSCFNEVVIPWSNDTVEPVAPGNVPARAVRPRVRGDRLRAQRDRLGEPLRRRQRPVHPRRGGRRRRTR